MFNIFIIFMFIPPGGKVWERETVQVLPCVGTKTLGGCVVFADAETFIKPMKNTPVGPIKGPQHSPNMDP